MSNTDAEKRKRAERTMDMALKLCEQVEATIKAEGVLQPPEQVSVFAGACAMSVAAWKEIDPAMASDLAAHALRTIIKNLIHHGVTIPALDMDGWTPPNIHYPPDTQH